MRRSSTILTAALLCLPLASCDSTTASGPTTPTPDAGAKPDAAKPQVRAPASCEAPKNRPSDPLTRIGTRVVPRQPGAGPTHLLDLVHDPAAKKVYLAGTPGVMAFDDSGSSPRLTQEPARAGWISPQPAAPQDLHREFLAEQ